MYRHIVLFKFRDDIDSLNREKAFLSFKEEIEALPAIIPTIKEIEVGENKNESEVWDICLNSLFESLEDIKTYGQHPTHREIAAKLKPLLASRSCVDYKTSID